MSEENKSNNKSSENKIYVGNLSYKMRDNDLEDYFKEFGEITDAKVIMERDNQDRSKGFGFVTFADAESAKSAVEKADGEELDGRNMKVSIAQNKPRDNNRRGGFRGGNDRRNNDRGNDSYNKRW